MVRFWIYNQTKDLFLFFLYNYCISQEKFMKRIEVYALSLSKRITIVINFLSPLINNFSLPRPSWNILSICPFHVEYKSITLIYTTSVFSQFTATSAYLSRRQLPTSCMVSWNPQKNDRWFWFWNCFFLSNDQIHNWDIEQGYFGWFTCTLERKNNNKDFSSRFDELNNSNKLCCNLFRPIFICLFTPEV